MIKNGLYNGITSILNIALGILVIPVLIRMMGLDAYGLWIYATAVIGIVELAEMGLSVSTTFFVSRDLANRDNRSLSETLSIICGLVLIVATIGAVAVWLLAAPLAHLAANLDPEQQVRATYIIRLGAFVVWVAMVQRVLIGIQQAFQRYDLLNLIASTQALLAYLSMLAVAFAGGGPEQLMVAYMVVTGMAFVANSIAVRFLLRPYAISICWNLQRVPVIARYSLSTWFISLGSALFSKGDRILVGAVAGTAVLGAYGAITSVVSKINQLSAAVVQPLLPSISGLSTRKNGTNQELLQHYRQAVELNTLVSFGLSGILLLLAPILSFVLVNQQSDELINSLVLATIIYGLYSLGAVPWYTLIARGKTTTVLRVNLLAAIVSLTLITVGAIQYGLMGAIVGNVGYLLILLLYIFAEHDLHIKPGSFGFWKEISFLWYLVVIGLSIILPTILVVRVFVALVTSLVLIWFTPLAKELLMSLPLIGSRAR